MTYPDNDEIRAYGAANNRGTQYNDIIYNTLRDFYGITGYSIPALPDLWHRFVNEGNSWPPVFGPVTDNGLLLEDGTSYLLQETGDFLIQEDAAGDTYWNNVVLLLHMNGADGTTTFTDVIGKSVTASGNAQIDTAQSKFGGASGLFDGSGDYITVADSNDFYYGTGDFTIEMFFRIGATVNAGTYKTLYMQRDGGGVNESLMILLAGTEKYYVAYSTNGTSTTAVTEFQTGSLPSVGTWTHLALCRSGANLRLFIDGQQHGTTHNIGTAHLYNAAAPLRIGMSDPTGVPKYDYNGHIDEYRITKGVARYTSNFTPPSAPFVERV